MKKLRAAVGVLVTLTALMPLACGLEITPPDEIELQVIEELTFAPTLGVDLSEMLQTVGGVYYKDIIVGEGDPLGNGEQPYIRYTGWLNDGTVFDRGEFGFLMGGGQVIPGFEQGVEGMRIGGVRLMVIPPELAYGTSGAGIVPPGSVLIFEAQLIDVAR